MPAFVRGGRHPGAGTADQRRHGPLRRLPERSRPSGRQGSSHDVGQRNAARPCWGRIQENLDGLPVSNDRREATPGARLPNLAGGGGV
jgi:hypothetical protein